MIFEFISKHRRWEILRLSSIVEAEARPYLLKRYNLIRLDPLVLIIYRVAFKELVILFQIINDFTSHFLIQLSN